MLKKPTRQVFINCGNTRLTAARFLIDPVRGLILEDFSRQVLDNSEKEPAHWLNALVDGLRLLPVSLYKGIPVTFLLPSSVTLCKYLKVPSLSNPQDQAEAIRYEVSQNIPYALDEVVYDFHILEDDGIEKELIVVLVKKEIIFPFAQITKSVGIETERIEASAIADALSIDFLQNTEKAGTLLINIGARTTNVLLNGTNSFALRSINVGGALITQEIANQQKIDYNEAEALKQACFLETAARPVSETARSVCSTSSESFKRRLVAELVRSLAGFRRQLPDDRASRVVLSGKGALLPGIESLLQEKLAMPVGLLSFADARLEVDESIASRVEKMDQLPLLAGELAGAAANLLRPVPVSVNLLPESHQKLQQFRRGKPYYLVSLLLLLLAGSIISGHFYLRHSALNGAYTRIKAKMAPYQNNDSDFNLKLEEKRLAEVHSVALDTLRQLNDSWPAFMDDLQARLATVEDTWLEGFALVPPLPQEETKSSIDQAINEDEYPDLAGDVEESTADRVAPVVMRMQGVMLDRENPLSKVSPSMQARVNQLLVLFSESEFIEEVGQIRFDPSKSGILRYEVEVSLNPKLIP